MPAKDGRTDHLRILSTKDVKLAGALESSSSVHLGKDAGLVAGCGACGVLITNQVEETIKNADVVIDFTAPDATLYPHPKRSPVITKRLSLEARDIPPRKLD